MLTSKLLVEPLIVFAEPHCLNLKSQSHQYSDNHEGLLYVGCLNTKQVLNKC